MIPVGLNPYGIAYCNGIAGRGTARANPRPLGVEGYVRLAEEIGARGVEFHFEMLAGLGDGELSELRERLRAKGWFVVVSSPLGDVGSSMAPARAAGAELCRMHLSPVLCGDRAADGCDWVEIVRRVKVELREAAKRAADMGLRLAIENHQDFTSAELVELCNASGENVGVCFDCGNALSVGEDPVAFAYVIKGRTFHVHMKDYRAQFTDEGYRLVRCAIGEGAVDFASIFRVLEEGARARLPTATIECGALNARHIRLFTREWWRHYPAKSAEALAAAVRAARVKRLPEDAEWRTPWEMGAGCEEVVAYEMEQLRRSVRNLRTLGLM